MLQRLPAHKRKCSPRGGHFSAQAADTARWRSRQRRGVQLFQIEAGPREYDLAVEYGGLREDQIADKAAIAAALGRLLRRALIALLREDTRRGWKNL
jgi:hypothetical protein